MIFRIAAGIFLILTGASTLGIFAAPAMLLGLSALVAGVALIAGV